jgi:biopolymer transport protein ExbB
MIALDTIDARARELWAQALEIWVAGGWGMIAIAVDALVLFALGFHVWLRLREKGFLSVPQKTWRRWLYAPGERRGPPERSGPIRELLAFVTGIRTLEGLATSFQGLRKSEVAPFERDLRMIRICVGVAPLLGLFGTVTGMLYTFNALAEGSGGEKTMGLVAKGISEALITTETGLVIALPGLFFQYQLTRKFERYKAFLAHLETVCAQKLYRDLRAREAA